MFIYLSKKIAIPNNTKLKSCSWSRSQGYIACGGDDGLLKVLKLDSGKETKTRGLAAPSNLSMNQTLDGHNGQIQVVTWNETHLKLTSSDSSGLIIVWMLYKGSWFEEMINNRGKSVVKGMAWNSDGTRISIVYEDGAVIVGSVDGNRIWGKEIKGSHLTGVEWSPDSRLLLFSIRGGDIHVYDNSGGYVTKVNIQCLPSGTNGEAQVTVLHWYNGSHGYVEADCPTLVICYDIGRMQLMRNENDDMPVLVDTGMTIVDGQWNHNGSIVAVAGSLMLSGNEGDKECNVVQFYTPFGEVDNPGAIFNALQHLRTLKVPGKNLTSCSWEGGSLRIALAIDSYIFFANIRPDYRWAYFSDTCVYTYTKAEQTELSMVFWNMKTNDVHTRQIRSLIAIAAAGEHCVIATRLEDSSGQNALLLYNSIGTPVDSKYIDIEPIAVTMTMNLVIAASREQFFVWQYRTPKAKSSIEVGLGRGESRRERTFHIDDNPSGFSDPIAEAQRISGGTLPTNDPICCMTCSESLLVIGRESGQIQRYSLPQVGLTNTYKLISRPYKLALNSNSKRLAIIDVTGLLTLLDLETRGTDVQGREVQGDFLKFERKDVWDLCWASDNPELFAMMEKTRMYIIRNLDPEEPIASAGYICKFSDLEITAVLLDELMKDPEHPSVEDWVLTLESKSLRDTRELLEKVGIKEANAFVEENPHPRLWRLLAESALNRLDLSTAEAAFVRCKDYPGIQFTKQLENIQSEALKRAEIAAYFKRDLAIALRRKLGDYARVVVLLRTASAGSDVQMEEAWNALGDHFVDRHMWTEAVDYFRKARNHEKLVKCYYMLEDYQGIENILMKSLPDGHDMIPEIGDMFQAVGMCEQAVKAYTKAGKIKEAIDCCVSLNQWQLAVKLAKAHKVRETGSLLSHYAQNLLDKDQRMKAVQLYRQAGHPLQAALLLAKVAHEEAEKKSATPRTLKKLYVLAALLVDEHRSNLRASSGENTASKSSMLLGLGNESNDSDGLDLGMALGTDGQVAAPYQVSLLENPWRGAEAYHFFLMAQRQLYEGYVDAAMKTALVVRGYEDFLPSEDVYCLLALSSCANRAFQTCSRAFIKLESLKEVDPTERTAYEDLAMDIFVKYNPKDSRSARAECPHCDTRMPDTTTACPNCGARFQICIATGRPLYAADSSSTWVCKRCRHRASLADMAVRQTCPLCHALNNSG
ncbi:unnamed protein product [Notodromas monacha]|uniref:WD repeat-containing protein 35 n=1 Tax=Notodromas monacha TaxID=399045 RepID=A0A7R9BLR5_9CRUS|nr:unnamed protein product [Notodromas monacha]CAG0916326.1 unnamed protein product [Notodromas monacha]